MKSVQNGVAFSIGNIDKVPLFKVKHKPFKKSFFPSTIIEWNKLNPNLRSEKSYHTFKKIFYNL